MRRRLAFVGMAVAMFALITPIVPAGATVNGGPWDVQMRWRTGTNGHLYTYTKVSVATDDTAAGRYRMCNWYTRHQVGGGNPTVSTWDGSVLQSHLGGGIMDTQGEQHPVAANAATYTIDQVNVIRSDASGGCDNPANFLPIRAYGSGVNVPTSHIIGMGTTDTVITAGAVANPLSDGAPPPSALPTTDATCSRILSQNNGANVGTFDATMATVTGITDTYSWVWGDGTTAGTTLDIQHIYPALSSMPAGGWTTTLTVTRTGNGTTYVVGPSTETCSLRVDFLNPEQSTPSTTTTDAQDDNDCPTGFGWINPLAILKVLKCLFIPSSDSVDSLGELWGDVTTKAPFSWAYDIVSFPGHFVDDMHDSAVDQYEADQGGTVCSNLVNGAVPGDAEVTNCEVAAAINGSSSYDAIRYFFVGLFLIAVAMGIYQTVVWTVS